MKKILTLFVCMLCLFPILANADDPCNNYNDNRSTCLAFGGCYWNDPDDPDDPGYCISCDINKYHESCDITQSNCDDGCHTCATGSGTTWNWDSNAPHPSNSIFDYANATLGQSSCPWICEADYYKSNNSCQQCPSNSTTESYSNGGATSINDCKCASHYYMGGSGNNTCKQCPEHSSCHTNGTDNNTGLTYNNVTCESGYTRYVNNNEVTCSIGCGLYAVPNSSNDGCICNVGYYGDGTTCSACPIGTTSAQGSQNISDCVMTSTTMFCDGTGQNCMQLIPNGTTISAH